MNNPHIWDSKGYYALLDVHPEASPDAIRAAYKKAMRLNHPDMGGDAETAAKINAAWEVLGDPKSRAAYDAEIPALYVRAAEMLRNLLIGCPLSTPDPLAYCNEAISTDINLTTMANIQFANEKERCQGILKRLKRKPHPKEPPIFSPIDFYNARLREYAQHMEQNAEMLETLRLARKLLRDWELMPAETETSTTTSGFIVGKYIIP